MPELKDLKDVCSFRPEIHSLAIYLRKKVKDVYKYVCIRIVIVETSSNPLNS